MTVLCSPPSLLQRPALPLPAFPSHRRSSCALRRWTEGTSLASSPINALYIIALLSLHLQLYHVSSAAIVRRSLSQRLCRPSVNLVSIAHPPVSFRCTPTELLSRSCRYRCSRMFVDRPMSLYHSNMICLRLFVIYDPPCLI